MTYTRKGARALLHALIVVLALVFAAAPAIAVSTPEQPGAVAAWDDRTGEELSSWECDWNNVCFWPEYNGVGARCMWSVDDPNWTSGSVTCSWAAVLNARSVMNMKSTANGGGIGVVYYKKSNNSDRAGCTRPEHGGNLSGTYQIRSHRWMPSGGCG
ncbi:hypothetical protein [Saccharothrix sp. Mg75]|uniref:hypothetical protein n=1 Tax=Saccharothrix sp. Mg75 TaxID=3445357 RepID=UPI003EE86E34